MNTPKVNFYSIIDLNQILDVLNLFISGSDKALIIKQIANITVNMVTEDAAVLKNE